MELTDTLALIAQGLLIIALPIVIAAAFQTFRVQSQKLGDEKLNALKSAAQTAVKVAEQTGLIEQLAGPEKREMAIQVAERFLKERGINMDLDQIAAVVEAEVLTQFHNPTPPSAMGLTKQDIIDKAIESAVLAAEQSGLTGTIENIGPEKHAYALEMARQYMKELGVGISDQLASSLIEAQLLRFRLAARGQYPEQPSSPAQPAVPQAAPAPEPKG